LNRAVGYYSFAAGRGANANHQGAFVWADSQDPAFSSTGQDQFLIRAAGGVGINTNSPQAMLDVEGAVRAGRVGYIFPDGTIQSTAAEDTVGGSGTPNYVPLWNGASTLGNSLITQQNSALTINYAPGWDSARLLVGGGFPDISPSGNNITILGDAVGQCASLLMGTDQTRFIQIGRSGYLGYPYINSPEPLLLQDGGGKVGITSALSDVTHKLTVHSSDANTVRLLGPGGWGSEAKLEFGDVGRVYIQEDLDDYLTIYGLNRTAIMGGNVGIGTTSPTQKLHVEGNICYTGSINTCSDARFKKDVQPLEGALGKVQALRPVSFNWKRDEYPDRSFSEDGQIGFIGQELEKVVPEAVTRGDDGYYLVDYSRLTPVLVQAVKEQQKAITDLKAEKDAEIAGLQQQIDELKRVVRTLVKGDRR